MSIKFNGEAIKAVKYNSLDIAKLMYGSELAWIKPPDSLVIQGRLNEWTVIAGGSPDRHWQHPEGYKIMTRNWKYTAPYSGLYSDNNNYPPFLYMFFPQMIGKDFNLTVDTSFNMPRELTSFITVGAPGSQVYPVTHDHAGGVGLRVYNDGYRSGTTVTFRIVKDRGGSANSFDEKILPNQVYSSYHLGINTSRMIITLERRGTTMNFRVANASTPTVYLENFTQTGLTFDDINGGGIKMLFGDGDGAILHDFKLEIFD